MAYAVKIKYSQISYISRYIDELLETYCFRDLLSSGIYESGKDLTIACAAINAIRHKSCGLDLSEPGVYAFCLSNDERPIVAAMLAYRTKWPVFAIGPKLRRDYNIVRLTIVNELRKLPHIMARKILIISTETQATFEPLWSGLRRLPRVAIGIGCISADITKKPKAVYYDRGLWQDNNRVTIWEDGRDRA